MLKSTLIVSICLLQTACATWEKDTLAYMGGSALLCGAATALSAPKDDNKGMHFALGGGLCSAAVGSYRLYMREPNDEIREKDLKIKELNIKLSNQDPQTDETIESAYGTEEMPEDIQKLIQPGLWKVFNINNWKKKSSNSYVHEDKILEFNPPKVKINK